MLIVFTTSYLYVCAWSSPSRPYDTATTLVSVLAGPLYISKFVSFGIVVGYGGSNSTPSPNSSIPTMAVILARCGLTAVVGNNAALLVASGPVFPSSVPRTTSGLIRMK